MFTFMHQGRFGCFRDRLQFYLFRLILKLIHRDFRQVGGGCQIGDVRFGSPLAIALGGKVILQDGSKLLAGTAGIELGNNCEIGYFSILRAVDGSIRLGNNCSLNTGGYMIAGRGGIKIGERCSHRATLSPDRNGT